PYFLDATDPENPIFAIITLPTFSLNGNVYKLNLNRTLPGTQTSRYSLVVGGKSYLFDPNNTRVTVNQTTFTFNPITGGVYTVSYAAVDLPNGPSPIPLTPFTITAGGRILAVDVFNNPENLQNMRLGVTGRLYSYNLVTTMVSI